MKVARASLSTHIELRYFLNKHSLDLKWIFYLFLTSKLGLNNWTAKITWALKYTVNNYRQVTGMVTGENFAFFIYRQFVEIL